MNIQFGIGIPEALRYGLAKADTATGPCGDHLRRRMGRGQEGPARTVLRYGLAKADTATSPFSKQALTHGGNKRTLCKREHHWK